MSDFNKVIFMGRLTVKPELRFTPSGMAVATLRIASSSRFKNKEGAEKEETCFIDAVVWGRQAETCAEYLVKGQRVLVEGRLVLRKWETAQGEKRQTYEIRAQHIQFMEKPKGKAGEDAADAAPLSDADAPAEVEEDGEDVPF